MKTTLGIILGVLLGLIIIVVVTVWILSAGFFSGSRPTNSGTVTIQSPSPSGSPAPNSTAVLISPSVVSESPAQSNVNFNLNITHLRVSGLTSLEAAAQITNTGTADAHNAWVKVEIISQGSIIKINGQDYLREDLGTIKAGQAVSPQVTINVGFADGIRISQSGATFRLTIFSDEKTETLSYDYLP